MTFGHIGVDLSEGSRPAELIRFAEDKEEEELLDREVRLFLEL